MRPAGRYWALVQRPGGPFNAGHVELREAGNATLADGECEVAPIFLSIDPTTRLWMADVAQPARPIGIGEPVRSFVYGTVTQSRNLRLPEGMLVWTTGAWADRIVVRAAEPIGPRHGLPLAAHASVLGLTGLTAWFAMVERCRPKPDDTVVVSGATGAVGAIAGQLAHIMGARPIGIVGTAERARRAVATLGYAAAVVRGPDLAADLAAVCPGGIDLVFENAGGIVLDAALGAINARARIILCGLMSGYDSADGWPVNQLRPILMKEARLEGFLISSCMDRLDHGRDRLAALVHAGRLRWDVDVVDGLEQAPMALARVLAGKNQGKQLVRLAPDPWCSGAG